MKLILHIGPHKTATTAIQRLLATNPEQLKAAGFVYETIGEINRGAHEVADLISYGKIESLDHIFDRIKKTQHNMVISSENFSRLNEQQAKELLGRFSNFDVRIIYYLRNPLDRIYSRWQEMVKHGFRYTFLEYVANILKRPFKDSVLNPTLHIAAWQNAAGSDAVEVVFYDRIPNIPENFISRFIGAEDIINTSRSRIKASFSPEKIEVLRALAGVQTCLLHSNAFNSEVAEIAGILATARDASGHTFSRTFALCWDSEILKSVEKHISEHLGFAYDNADPLFEKRRKEYSYFLNTVWLESPKLQKMLVDLRKDICEKFEKVPFDERLLYM